MKLDYSGVFLLTSENFPRSLSLPLAPKDGAHEKCKGLISLAIFLNSRLFRAGINLHRANARARDTIVFRQGKKRRTQRTSKRSSNKVGALWHRALSARRAVAYRSIFPARTGISITVRCIENFITRLIKARSPAGGIKGAEFLSEPSCGAKLRAPGPKAALDKGRQRSQQRRVFSVDAGREKAALLRSRAERDRVDLIEGGSARVRARPVGALGARYLDVRSPLAYNHHSNNR